MKLQKKMILPALLLVSLNICAQDFHFGLKGGGTANRSIGNNFNSRRTYGYNFGGFVSYNVISKIGFQVEGLYGATALRVNDASEYQDVGTPSGKKRLHYFSLPLLLKVDVTGFFSVVAGPQFNYLKNNDTYRLNNGSPAFDSKIGTSYAAGVDLGPFYFRYLWGKQNFNNVAFNSDLSNRQYQVGFRVVLL